MKTDYPIFFPGVINTSTTFANKLTNPVIRRNETRNSVYQIIKNRCFKKIVIIDGSNTAIFTNDELEYFRESGQLIEQLLFKQDATMVQKYGKSNGECQLISHAIANSELVKSSGGFYKLSPRYHFDNIESVLINLEGDNIFYSYNIWPITLRSPFIMTIFYKTSLTFYREVLANAIHYCSNQRDGYLEAVFYKLIYSRRKKLLFTEYPHFSGTAGTTGAPIQNGKYFLRNIASKTGLLAASYY